MQEEQRQDKKELKSNPIDIDKIAANPHLLPYAHTVGGAVIKPIDRGRVKGLALKAMYKQTDLQLDQIREQINLLAQQANRIQDRVLISEQIYTAQCGFKPNIGETYFLYTKSSGEYVLSMVGPTEWGAKRPYEYQATVNLLADHTWNILEKKGEF